MAKKRRKRSGPSARSGTATRARPSSEDAPQAIRPAPASPGGPNRVERKEVARKARERLRRQMARRRTYRRLGIGLIAGVLVAGIVVLATRPKGSTLNSEEKRLLAAAPAAMKTAGCGAVQTIKPYPNGNDRTHIGGSDMPTLPPLSTYPSQPPASGPHNGTPLRAGVYSDPPPIDQAIHSLEHAAVIVWFAPEARTQNAVTQLQTFFGQAREQTKVIVAPYSYPDQGDAGKLPAGKQMILV